MRDAVAWLEARDAGIPASLATAMKDAVQHAPEPADTAERAGPGAGAPDAVRTRAVAAALAEAGLALLKEVASGGGRRDSARALLAADALVTLACEAAAEDPAALESLLDQLGVPRFEAVLEAASS